MKSKEKSENHLGKIIKQWRKQRNFTQEGLAFATNLSFHSISSIERGINMPTVKTLQKISKVLDIPVSIFNEITDKEHTEKEKLIQEIVGMLYTLKKEDLNIVIKLVKSFK